MDQTKIIIIFCCIAATVTSGNSDGLENFVEAKLANYTTWLKAGGLDPSPALQGPISFQITDAITNLDITLSEFSVQGHSDGVEYEIVETDMTKGMFRATLNTRGNITFFGQYKANGTLLSSIPVATEGNWHVSVEDVEQLWFYIYFPVSPVGFLNVTNYQLFIIYFRGEYDVHFQDLWEDEAAEGFEEFIKESVFKGFQTWMEDSKYELAPIEDPIRALYLRYSQEILTTTNLADIIGATEPPPSTTSTTTTTTTPDPCQCQEKNTKNGIPANGAEVVEKTVEMFEEKDDFGVPFKFTKTVIVTKERKEL